MPTRLSPFPSPLLQHLGLASDLTRLEQFFKDQEWPVPALRQSRNTDVYPVSIPGKGLDLMLQCINLRTSENECQSGLQSITLHTAQSDAGNYWQGEWPAGLDTQTINPGDIVSQLAEDNNEAVLLADFITKNFKCNEIHNIAGYVSVKENIETKYGIYNTSEGFIEVLAKSNSPYHICEEYLEENIKDTICIEADSFDRDDLSIVKKGGYNPKFIHNAQKLFNPAVWDKETDEFSIKQFFDLVRQGKNPFIEI